MKQGSKALIILWSRVQVPAGPPVKSKACRRAGLFLYAVVHGGGTSAANASRHAACLRSNAIPACAGLVDGSRMNARPSGIACRPSTCRRKDCSAFAPLKNTALTPGCSRKKPRNHWEHWSHPQSQHPGCPRARKHAAHPTAQYPSASIRPDARHTEPPPTPRSAPP